MLQSELVSLPSVEVGLQVLEVARAADAPGDPYSRLVLLVQDETTEHWQMAACPEAFSWLCCGTLAASATPQSEHLQALKALGLEQKVCAEAIGAPTLLVEHLEGVVGQIAKILAGGGGCLVHSTDGFRACGVALACFAILHCIDETPQSERAAQPAMTAPEAIEVLRAMRPGAVATEQDQEEIELFAQEAWGKHVERVQRAFCGSAGVGHKSESTASVAAAPSRPAPASTRVVKQPGDGNCLFHSLAFGLGKVTAATLRGEICGFMERRPDLSIAGTTLADWIQMVAGCPVAQYAKKMAKSAQWGGAPEIAACAHMRHTNIHVYERRGSGFDLTVPFDVGGSSTICVLYVGGVHYDALVL